MLPTCDPERLLSMSAFEAAFVLRRFRLLNPTYQDEQLIESIRSVRADFYPNDYDAGLALERIIPASLDGTSDVDYFKAAIEGVINTHQPLWVRLAPVGREYVLRAVSINGTQCFRNAGLLETPPGREVSVGGMLLPRVFATKKTCNYLTKGERQSDVRWNLNVAACAHWESTGNHAGYRSRTITQVMTFSPTSPAPSSR